MRLLRKDGTYIAHFTVVGEVQDLAEREEGWMLLYVVGEREPVGEIQSRTYEVRVFDPQVIQDRQVVILGKDRHSTQSPVSHNDNGEQNIKK